MTRVKRAITLDADKHERLMALAAETRVPAAEYIREGIERVLDLAEKQQDAIERAIREDRKLD